MTFLKSQMKQVPFKSAGDFGLCGVLQTPRCFTLAKFSTLKKKKKSVLRKGHDLFKPPGAAGRASKYTTYCERCSGLVAGILVTYIILVYLWFMKTETTSFFPHGVLAGLPKSPAQWVFLSEHLTKLWAFFFPFLFLFFCWVLALRSSEPPGVPHHENKVGVAVDGGTDTAVVVNKLLLGHLWIDDNFTSQYTKRGNNDDEKSQFGVHTWRESREGGG